MGRFKDAETHFDKAISILIDLAKTVNPDLVLSVQEQKADLYAKFDQNEKAREEYTAILKTKEIEAKQSDRLEIANIKDKIGRVLVKMDKFDEALSMFDQAIALKADFLGPSDV
jgi:tetratricopeptide (TPR) repeat protein